MKLLGKSFTKSFGTLARPTNFNNKVYVMRNLLRAKRTDYKEIFFSEIVSLTGGLFAGAMLATWLDKLILVPGIFILVPGFLEMRGSISGSLSGRISSGLFLNVIKPKFSRQKLLVGNIITSFGLAVCVSTVLGFLAFVLSFLFFGLASASIILIAIVAGVLSNLIEIPLAIAALFWLFKRGYDPNNVMGPYITTIGDITSIATLLLAVWLI